MRDWHALLGQRDYPGRGLFAGQSPDGKAVLAYFIMGRSANSRRRAFEEAGDSLRIRPLGGEAVRNPDLVLYTPIRPLGDCLVAGNGDQVDTICEYMAAGKSFREALESRSYEPDAPHYTPRISALLDLREGRFRGYNMAILRSANGRGGPCERAFFHYAPEAGRGHFLSTYGADGDPLPSWRGGPARLCAPGSIDEFFTGLWELLDPGKRVALYVRYTDPRTGRFTSRLRNAKEM